MTNRIHTLFIIGLLTFLSLTLVGCKDIELPENSSSFAIRQTHFISDKGYNIKETKGLINSYILKRNMLADLPYSNYWGLQEIEASSYIGKQIDIYSYIVDNHPLDTLGDLNETKLWLMVCENEIIGGYSLQNNSVALYGGVYSLDGLTLEEFTGMDFPTLQENWQNKYN